jgi:hypothetical protein
MEAGVWNVNPFDRAVIPETAAAHSFGRLEFRRLLPRNGRLSGVSALARTLLVAQLGEHFPVTLTAKCSGLRRGDGRRPAHSKLFTCCPQSCTLGTRQILIDLEVGIFLNGRRPTKHR